MKIRLAWALMAAVGVNAAAKDWTEFRGPGAQGHAEGTNLPTKWSDSENVLWKTPIAGLGWSSPVVLGNRIFLTTAVSDAGPHAPSQLLRALCVKLETGTVEWDVEVFKQASVNAAVDRVHNKNSQASPTPITDGQFVFVHFGTRGTACLTLDGKLVWQNQDLKYNPVHGNGGSPVLFGDTLIVSCDGGDKGFITALDRATGKVRWQQDRSIKDVTKKFAFGTPLLIEVNGQKQLISQGAGAVYGYKPETGEEIWRARYGDGYSVIPRPVYAHGLLYVGTGYDQAKLIAVDPTGQGDVTESHIKWTMTRGAPHTPSPLVVGDELYVVSDKGIATCLNAKTGEQIWQERLGGNYSSSPLFADGKIYMQSEEGESIIIKPGTTYSEIARNKLEPRTFASHAVVGSTLLVRTEKHLYRIGAK